MVVGLRVESENIQTGAVRHCNSSYFTMVAKNKKGQSVPVPGLILDTEQLVRRFARSIRRQEQAKMRDKNFDPDGFRREDYLELISTQNAKIVLKGKL